ncbi:substance-P receptor-like [Sinocyclocheilus grahami]|uniref:substance-P receptor-like n=1 Tax=Sinocyclocheilus grahami TaxID=75366 RepID=UPI0007AC80BD|nr:PREDICTED: substance-P receptor-like [Sinocyclocheilus grahami]
MMIVVECTFAICWLPYHVYFLLHQFLPHLFEEQYIQQVYLGIMWLAMSSTMYNPIIYCLLNDRFRAGFQQAFSWCPCVPQGSYEGLELKSTRYLQTQASIYRASRMETTVSTVMPVIEGDLRENTNRCSIDLTSNGSSQSASKTVSESSSFYSSNNLA